ncbi:hypothetical protein [Pedobacter ginsengisoli]|uniref:hypothetical protein n=1 Tax=Pedobacter ginsengisoli TaxID=363852 RepID=UPI00254DFA20|nr:hypothetical protein [Pedobacter ginsengisoli]
MAQTDEVDDKKTKKTTLTLAAIYSNNVSYYGQSTAEKLPYVLANATARLSMGLYFSAGAYKLLKIGGGISETDLGIGYEHNFTDKFNADVSYTRSIFPSNSPLLQAANTNNINLTLSYTWPWFKSSLSADHAFGEENDFFLGITNAKDISLGTIFYDQDQLSIEPAIEIISGTQHFYTTYQEEKIKRNNGKGKGANNGNGNPEGSREIITIPKTSFNLLTYNFRLPLAYSRSSYLAEVAYQFSVLSDEAITEAKKQQSFISLSFYYQF